MVHDLNRQWNEQLSESEVQRHTKELRPWSNWTPIIVSRVLRDTNGGFPMAEDQSPMDERPSLREAQSHATWLKRQSAAKHYQASSKPPPQVWHRLYSIARYVIAAIAIVGLLILMLILYVVGLLIFRPAGLRSPSRLKEQMSPG